MPPATRRTANIQSKILIYILKTTVTAVNDHGVTGMVGTGVAGKVDGNRAEISRNAPASLRDASNACVGKTGVHLAQCFDDPGKILFDLFFV